MLDRSNRRPDFASSTTPSTVPTTMVSEGARPSLDVGAAVGQQDHRASPVLQCWDVSRKKHSAAMACSVLSGLVTSMNALHNFPYDVFAHDGAKGGGRSFDPL